MRSEVGTVQGGSVSPLLANIYLHYVLDLWAQQWRKTQAQGDMSSCVLPMTSSWFEHRQEPSDSSRNSANDSRSLAWAASRQDTAHRFGAMRTRIDETAATETESFNFLGFTHISGKTRKGGSRCCGRRCAKGGRQKSGGANRTETTLARPVPEVALLRSVVTGTTATTGCHERSRARAFRNAIVSPGDGCSGAAARRANAVEPLREVCRALAATPPHLPSLSLVRSPSPPKARAGCVMPPVRICGGVMGDHDFYSDCSIHTVHGERILVLLCRVALVLDCVIRHGPWSPRPVALQRWVASRGTLLHAQPAFHCASSLCNLARAHLGLDCGHSMLV